MSVGQSLADAQALCFHCEMQWLRLSPYLWFPTPSIDGPPERRMHESWVRNQWFIATVCSSTSLPSEYVAL
jgi:hypothetical protein